MAQITLNSSGVASSGTLALQSNGTTTAVTIDASQNVGVGVTPSAWGGGKNIQLAASSSVVGSNDEVYLAANSYFNGTNNKYIANGFATQYSQETGVHKWFIAPTGTAGNNITFTRAMTLDASGNLGIGVTPSGWGSTYKAQQIGQAGVLSGHTSVPAMTLTSNAYENSGWKAITTSSAHRIDLSSDNNATIFYRAPSVSAGSALTWSESMRLDSSGNLLFNSGYGSVATAYGCRAWVNFNGTGTPAIRGSGNVSSITDGGTGTFTVNFTTSMPDQNYSAVGSAVNSSSSLVGITAAGGIQTPYFEIRVTNDAGSLQDPNFCCYAVFR